MRLPPGGGKIASARCHSALAECRSRAPCPLMSNRENISILAIQLGLARDSDGDLRGIYAQFRRHAPHGREFCEPRARRPCHHHAGLLAPNLSVRKHRRTEPIHHTPRRGQRRSLVAAPTHPAPVQRGSPAFLMGSSTGQDECADPGAMAMLAMASAATGGTARGRAHGVSGACGEAHRRSDRWRRHVLTQDSAGGGRTWWAQRVRRAGT